MINSRKLGNLNDRAEDMIEQGQVKKLQSGVSKIGHALLSLSLYNTEDFPKNIKEKIHVVATKMHIMETEKSYSSIDQKSFRERLDKLSKQLNKLAIEIP